MACTVPALQASNPAPLYMAPELLGAGAGGQPSTASDLWSLGCVLYECAAGRPPFVASSISSLAALVQSGSPPPLIGVAWRALTTLAAGSGGLEAILCMAAAQRYCAFDEPLTSK